MLPLRASAPAPAEGVRLVEPVLHWVVRGSATIVVGGAPRRVEAGRALWAAAGSDVTVRLGPHDVVVPVPGLRAGTDARPVLVEVPPSWRPWLLHAFGGRLGYLEGASSRPLLQRLLDAAAPEPVGAPHPPAPTSSELVALAAAIVATPAVPVGLLAQEHLVGWSSRTLQRRFVAETGLSPMQWAQQHRIAAAAQLLAQGHDVTAVAHRVGYTTASGLSRAFRAHLGMAPGQWRDRVDTDAAVCRPDAAPPADLLPAQRTWPRVNGSHVAVWVVRGSARLRVAGRLLDLAAGEAAVLPAGLPNDIRIPAGALVLPVGFRSGRGAPVPTPSHSVAVDDDDGMIQWIVAAYTGIRPRSADAQTGFDAVAVPPASTRETEQDMIVAALASGLAAGDLVDTSIMGCARWVGIAQRDLSRIVNERTGATFAQWIRLTRMSRARAQLHGGAAASVVSRGLGYAHLPAFSRAFREVHGASPHDVASLQGAPGEAGRWHARIRRELLAAP